MSNRATEVEVLEILDTALEAEDITPFLSAANASVSGRCGGVGSSADDLKLIETWLAAHLVCTKDPQIAEEKTGESRWKYDGKTALGLDSTRYGQQVKLLDYKSRLAVLDSSKGSAEFKTIA